MMTTKRTAAEFKPNFTFIPADSIPNDDHSIVEPNECTPMMLDSSDNEGWLYTKAEWESDAEPRYHRDFRGDISPPVEDGVIELLPDVWIVKIDETEYYSADVTGDPELSAKYSRLAKRIFGVYVLDRNVHHNLCEFTPSYELRFLGSEADLRDELNVNVSDANFYKEIEELDELLREGDRWTDEYGYRHVSDVEPLLKLPCKRGWLPEGKAGAYKFDSDLVRSHDVFNEVIETKTTSCL